MYVVPPDPVVPPDAVDPDGAADPDGADEAVVLLDVDFPELLQPALTTTTAAATTKYFTHLCGT